MEVLGFLASTRPQISFIREAGWCNTCKVFLLFGYLQVPEYPNTYADIKQKYQNGNIHRKLKIVMSTISCPNGTVLYTWIQKLTDIEILSFRWILTFWYFCFIFGYKVSLDLYATRKQKYQNSNIHRNLRVPTSKREGKLSNPHARAPRARDAWRKFTEIYGNPRGRAARAPCIDFLAAKYTVSILEGK